MVRTSITAVIITFNEEKNIGKCLGSLEGIVDEILVVDSFSTDRTKDICLEHDLEFYTHVFEGYGQQKNYGADLAKNDFVLCIDADEVLSDGLKHEILNIKEKGLKGVYSLSRITNYCGTWVKHSGWYPDVKPRIYNRHEAKWSTDQVHERLVFDGKSRPLKEHLLHFSFHSIEQHVNTVNKFSSLKAQGLFDKGKKFTYLKLLFKPAFKFFKIYILKMGFRDGFAGYAIARNSAYGDFLKYAKLRMLERGKKQDKN